MEKRTTTQKRMTPPKIRPKYEMPTVVTYSKDEILKQMGPARGGSINTLAPDAIRPQYRRRENANRGSIFRRESIFRRSIFDIDEDGQ